MANTIEIILKATDQASQVVAQMEAKVTTGAQGAADSLTKLGQAGQDSGAAATKGAQGFESFAGKLVAIQAGVGIAKEAIAGLKEVWDFAKEGAENQRIAQSFSRTAESIGASADDIIQKLDAAAKGTVDDEELMQASTRALTLGVAKSGDDLVNVMKLARAAALQFGGDAGTAFESINQAIGNLAPRALKQYGIIVNLGEANKKYADAIGTTVDALTEEQQRQALLNEVLIQGAKNFGDVGDAAVTTAEKMKALETRAANLLDIVKEVAATGIGTAFDIAEAPAKAFEAFAGTAEKLRAEVASGEISVRDYNDALKGMADTISAVVSPGVANATLNHYKLNEAQAAQLRTQYEATQGNYGYASSLDEGNRAALRAAELQHKLQQEFNAVQQGARNQAETYAVLDAAMDRTTSKANLLASSQKMIAQDMTDLKTIMAGALKNETENFTAKQGDLEKKSADLRAQIDKLQSIQGRAVTVNRDHALSANELTLAQLKLGEAQTRLSQETDPIKQAELRVQIDKQKESLYNATGSVTAYIDNSKKIKELEGQYDVINKEIDANAAAHDEATKRILFDYAEQQLAIGGLTATEAKALDALAVQWNLKSQSDVAAMQAIRDAAAGLAKDNSIGLFTDRLSDSLNRAEGKVTETQKSIERATSGIAAAGIPIPVSADTSRAETDIEKAKQKIATTPIVLTTQISIAEQAQGKAGDSLQERLKQLSPTVTTKVGIDTTQATKDIQAYTTDQVGGIPATKKTTAIFDTYKATSDANTLLKLFGTIPAKKETEVNVDGKYALQTLDDIVFTLDRIVSKTVEVIVKYKQEGESPRGAQRGLDMIVPPSPTGRTGDYFPFLAAAGERVTVQTPAQQMQGGAVPRNGDTFIYNTNVYNPLAAAMLADKQRRDRLARSNSRMGVT